MNVTNSVLLDTASWGLIAGLLTPLLVAAVEQPKWSSKTRSIAHAVVAVVVGLLTCLANGSLTSSPQTVLSIIALVLVTSGSTYRSLWKNTVAPTIEHATSNVVSLDSKRKRGRSSGDKAA